MGIGTLIIFIALLLVAAIASGVLIQSSSTLQEKALMTGTQAEGQIATGIKVVELSATDGIDAGLNHFIQIVKLSPGSSDIKLDEILITMNSFDKSASLRYRGTAGTFVNSNSGYNTYSTEEVMNHTGAGAINISMKNNFTLTEDYDDDGSDDWLTVTPLGKIAIYFSGGGNYTVPATSVTCSGAQHEVSQVTVTANTAEIGEVYIDGDCGRNYFLTSNLSVNVTPAEIGKGYFTVQYLQRGANPVVGNLQRGDIVKMYFEAPKTIGEDEKIRVNFIPKTGSPTLTEFITPEVISTERVYLYP